MPPSTNKIAPRKFRAPRETRDGWLEGSPKIKLTRWMPQSPTVKQHAFLACDHVKEVFYGGAAGGAKSSALLLGALQYVDVPGYAAILFRRTFADLGLPGALMDRAKSWLMNDPGVKWNDRGKTFTFPSGATLTFGYLQHTDDKYRYKSAEFQYIGFDEVTEFPEDDYTYLFSRLRRPSGIDDDAALANVPLRMRAASNPGGRGHRWTKNRFLENSISGERIFISSKLTDNPHIDQDAYRASLKELDEQTRLQLEQGDWNARGPGNWMIEHTHLDAAIELGRQYDKLLKLGELWEPSIDDGVQPFIWAGVDWGEHTQGYAIWPLEKGGIYVLPSEGINEHGEASEFAETVLTGQLNPRSSVVRSWLDFGYPLRIVFYDAAGVQSNRTFGKTARKLPALRKMRTEGVPFNKYKRETILYMRWLCKRAFDGYDTSILAISPRNTRLCDQIYEWERKNEETEEAIKEDDHGPDAVVSGIAHTARHHRERVAAAMEAAKKQSNQAELAAA